VVLSGVLVKKVRVEAKNFLYSAAKFLIKKNIDRIRDRGIVEYV